MSMINRFFYTSILTLALLIAFAQIANAQTTLDAPNLLMDLVIKNPFDGEPVGTVPGIMTRETYEHYIIESAIVGYVFELDVPTRGFAMRIPVFYYWDGSGTRMCDLNLYHADIPNWTGLIPAYVRGSTTSGNCPGAMPLFEDDGALAR